MQPEFEHDLSPAQNIEQPREEVDYLSGVSDAPLHDLLVEIDSIFTERDEALTVSEMRDILKLRVKIGYVEMYILYEYLRNHDVIDFQKKWVGKKEMVAVDRAGALLFSTATYIMSGDFSTRDAYDRYYNHTKKEIDLKMKNALGESPLGELIRKPLNSGEIKAKAKAKREGRDFAKGQKVDNAVDVEVGGSNNVAPKVPDEVDPESVGSESEEGGGHERKMDQGEDFDISYYQADVEYLSRQVAHLIDGETAYLTGDEQRKIMSIAQGLSKISDNMPPRAALIRATRVVINLLDKYPKMDLDNLYSALVEISRKRKEQIHK